MNPAARRGVARLEPHPESARPAAGLAIEVGWSMPGAALLQLEYALAGPWAELRMPAAAEARRENGLWRHTCFEAFVGEAGAGDYAEFNCSPSGAWAAYRFARYRADPQPLASLAQLPIATRVEAGRFLLAAELDLACLPAGYRRPLALALAAVLEHADGERSYWALVHPSVRADFHDSRGFALALPG